MRSAAGSAAISRVSEFIQKCNEEASQSFIAIHDEDLEEEDEEEDEVSELEDDELRERLLLFLRRPSGSFAHQWLRSSRFELTGLE